MVTEIKNWVEDKLKEEGWEDAFLIDVATNNKKVLVYLDADNGISFDRCRKMSRHLESYLDEQAYQDGRYTLEVSSPGVDRPIILWRQFVKNKGRNLNLLWNDGTQKEVELLEAENEQITIRYPHPEKKKEWIEEVVDFKDIKEAIVQISFKKKKK